MSIWQHAAWKDILVIILKNVVEDDKHGRSRLASYRVVSKIWANAIESGWAMILASKDVWRGGYMHYRVENWEQTLYMIQFQATLTSNHTETDTYVPWTGIPKVIANMPRINYENAKHVWHNMRLFSGAIEHNSSYISRSDQNFLLLCQLLTTKPDLAKEFFGHPTVKIKKVVPKGAALGPYEKITSHMRWVIHYEYLDWTRDDDKRGWPEYLKAAIEKQQAVWKKRKSVYAHNLNKARPIYKKWKEANRKADDHLHGMVVAQNKYKFLLSNTIDQSSSDAEGGEEVSGYFEP